MRIETCLHVIQTLEVSQGQTFLTLAQATALPTDKLTRILNKLIRCQLVYVQKEEKVTYVLIKPYKLMRVSDIIPLISKRDTLYQALAYRLRFHSLSVLIDPITSQRRE